LKYYTSHTFFYVNFIAIKILFVDIAGIVDHHCLLCFVVDISGIVDHHCLLFVLLILVELLTITGWSTIAPISTKRTTNGEGQQLHQYQQNKQ
jgi:hypothetical protein